MIAAWHSWDGAAPKGDISGALSAFGTAGSDRIQEVSDGDTRLYAPLIASGSTGKHCAFSGWIDNAPEISRLTGTDPENHAALYMAAVDSWGDAAERRLMGSYAAIVCSKDGGLRLSRSPWSAPPLYYANNAGFAAVSPLLRALFVAGVPEKLDYDYVVDQLAYDFRDGDDAFLYHGIRKVPMGSIVKLGRKTVQVNRWYSVADIPRQQELEDGEAAHKALGLLQEAAKHSLHSGKRPALALSGGLDSSLAATCLLDQLPVTERLKTISFGPHPDWPGVTAPGIMGDELPLVREFAAMHPRIDMHVSDPSQAGFDFRSRDMMRAMGIFAPGLANVGMYHGVYSKAKELGCGTLLTADLANQSFSSDGRWAYIEYARSGQWAELFRLLDARPGDARPMWRKLSALSILPMLPVRLRAAIRAKMHPQRRDMLALLTPLSDDARAAQSDRARRRGSQSDWEDFTFARSRIEAAMHDNHAADGLGADVDLAFQQLYGIQKRDVTAYRPLIEFCIGLPTGAFASGGEERRLARLMAKGRLPEAQRLNPNYGQHNIDWHTRIGSQRVALIEALDTMRGHPFLAKVIDIDRVEHLLRNWPDAPSFEIEEDWPRMLAIPRAILAAQFIGLSEGRNDL